MLDWKAILAQFPAWSGTAEPDSYRDFLGVRTRMSYMPEPYWPLAGTVEGTPGTDRAGLHDIVEWTGMLQAVLDARDHFTCVELGAGWGPFVVGSAKAAQRRGIRQIKLAAVEGAQSHLDFMHQHFIDNGLRPEQHRLIYGVVGTYDGIAAFPRLKEPTIEWGGEAIYTGSANSAGRTPQRTIDDLEEVACLTLSSILEGLPCVDVVHFDIQGSEADVIEQGIDDLDRKVRRIVIGTHGRDLENRLLHFLDDRSWTLEMDQACSYQQASPHKITLLRDGVQVWRNNRAGSPVTYRE